MPKEKGTTFCILCQEELVFSQLYAHEEYLMFCNNPSCGRFGLPTMVSTPHSKVKQKELSEENEED